MSRVISFKTILLQAAIASAVAAPAFVFAQNEEPKTRVPKTEPSAIPSTSKDAPPDGAQENPSRSDGEDQAIARFEVFNGVDINVAADGQIKVLDIKEKTVAARTGLMKGDSIIEVDSHKLKSRADTEDLLRQTAVQPYRVVRVMRDGEEIEVVLGRHLDLLGMLIVPDSGSRPLVRRVEAESPAEAAGVHVDDIIVGVSGRKTESYKQINEFVVPLVRKMSAGQDLNLRLLRDAEEVEVTVIRPENVKLPLMAAPEKPLPGDRSARPRRAVQRTHTENNTYVIQQDNGLDDEAYLNGSMGLASPFVGSGAGVVPFIGFGAGGTGVFPALPTNVDSVVASLFPTNTGNNTGSNGTNGALNQGTGTLVDPNTRATTPNNANRRTRGNRQNGNPNTEQNPGGVPIDPIPPAQAPANPPTPAPQALPNQGNLRQVVSPKIQQNQGNLNQGNLQNPSDAANQNQTEVPPTPSPANPTTAVPNDTTGTGSGPENVRGFVQVSTNGGAAFLQARIVGLTNRTYSLVVHEFGDNGDAAQNSTGQIIGVLASFSAGADGRAEISQNLNQGIAPSALVGRVVSVVRGSFNTDSNTFDDANAAQQNDQARRENPDGNPLTDEGNSSGQAILERQLNAQNPNNRANNNQNTTPNNGNSNPDGNPLTDEGQGSGQAILERQLNAQNQNNRANNNAANNGSSPQTVASGVFGVSSPGRISQ